ncbi:hypothetical protein YC2023_029760 [Brassica napus]
MGGGDGGDDSVVHFVFVHGASHGAWCWYKLTTLLAAAGFKATSVDLTGAGINLTDSNTVVDFDQYNRPLFSLLSDLPRHHKIYHNGALSGADKLAPNPEAEKVPRVYIKTAKDNLFDPLRQDRVVEKWPPSQLYILEESDHSAFFSVPTTLFAYLVRAVSFLQL